MVTDDLISPEYLELQKQLHSSGRYGVSSQKWVNFVRSLYHTAGAQSILDYGCGQGRLAKGLHPIKVREYDPAIKGKNQLPEVADVVVCTDTLEHVEPEKIECVLDHIRSLTHIYCFVVIGLTPSTKTMKDGRNAHLLLRSPVWWTNRLKFHGFTVVEEPACKPSREWAAVLE